MNKLSNRIENLQPLSLLKALLIFGGASCVFGINIYLIMPYLYHQGLSLFYNWLLSLFAFGTLLLAAFIGFKQEGHSWSQLKTRFRLKPMKKSDWFWGIGSFLFGLATYLGLSFTMEFIPRFEWLDESIYLKMFVDTYAGFDFKGNYWILGMHVLYMFVNVFGEELFWRGYIFPRQEKQHGKFTWIIHGTLWALFHAFHYWDVIKLLPGCLFLSYAVQKTGNTKVAIIDHLLFNSMALWVVLLPRIIS